MPLSDVAIKQKIKKGEIIIEPFEEERLGKGLYRLRAGKRVIKSFKGAEILLDLEREKAIRIESEEYITVETLEKIALPPDVRGCIVRSPQLETGLGIIEVYLEPGFEGRPLISVLNRRPLYIDLEFGDELCLILFEEVE